MHFQARKVLRRKYVQLDEQTRQMKPSELGLALCHAYMLIDPESFGSRCWTDLESNGSKKQGTYCKGSSLLLMWGVFASCFLQMLPCGTRTTRHDYDWLLLVQAPWVTPKVGAAYCPCFHRKRLCSSCPRRSSKNTCGGETRFSNWAGQFLWEVSNEFTHISICSGHFRNYK